MFDIDAFLQSPWFAVLAGLVGQLLVTQRLKFFLPAGWSDFKRARVIEFGLALPLGWLPPMVAYAGMNGWSGHEWHIGFWLGFIVWGAGVAIYKIAVRWLAKKDPDMARTLSAQVEAEKRRKVVHTKGGLEIRDADQPSEGDDYTVAHLDVGDPTEPRKP